MVIAETFTEAFELLSEEGIYSVWLLLPLYSGGKNEGVCKTKSNFKHQLKRSCIPRILVVFGGFDDQRKSTIIS